jgi:hypothetical protein
VLEKNIEKKIVDYAKKYDIISYKLNSETSKGLPDRMFITRTGVIFFVEFKRKGKTPNELQQFIINKLIKRKCLVSVIDDVDSGIELIDAYK